MRELRFEDDDVMIYAGDEHSLGMFLGCYQPCRMAYSQVCCSMHIYIVNMYKCVVVVVVVQYFLIDSVGMKRGGCRSCLVILDYLHLFHFGG